VALNHSVQKTVSLLRAAASHRGGASVSALARAAGLPRATALRLIQTLEAEGLLLRVPGADRVRSGPSSCASHARRTSARCWSR
jgi:DNA-binding IclR family transcriptional regulator